MSSLIRRNKTYFKPRLNQNKAIKSLKTRTKSKMTLTSKKTSSSRPIKQGHLREWRSAVLTSLNLMKKIPIKITNIKRKVKISMMTMALMMAPTSNNVMITKKGSKNRKRQSNFRKQKLQLCRLN